MNTVTLNKQEKKFLANYCPEDKHFTSLTEIREVTNQLGLDTKRSTELTAIRNTVVEYYANRMELAGDNKEEVMDRWMSAMQSVTAVIDDVMVKKYGIL